MGLTYLSFLIVLLMGFSLGAIFSTWIGALATGLLFVLLWPLSRWMQLELRLAKMPLAMMGPVTWAITGGVYVFMLFQHPAVREHQRNIPIAPLLQDVVATPNVIFPKHSRGTLRVEKDLFTYELTIRYRKGLKLRLPKITAHPIFNGPFVMPADKPPKIRFLPAKDGVVTKRWTLTLIPVSTGPLHTPRFEIQYLKNGKWKKVRVSRIAIDVSDLGKPQQLLASLVDQKPPILPERPSDKTPWLWLSTFATLLLLSLGGAAWLRRRQTWQAPPLPAHDWFAKELESLKSQKLLKKQLYKVYYFGLSEIFRGYMERRYEFPALESTSEEILSWCKNQDRIQQDVYRDVRKVLLWMDSIKFAGHLPSEEEMEDTEKHLQSVVRRTRPQPQEKQKTEENGSES